MPSECLVSVLLPIYQAGATLAACLKSIQRQTLPRWQCVILDDGSSDRSLDCARAFVADDPRFEIVERPHRGLVDTLNAGLPYCRGRYIARMDADDLMHRERLRLQVELLQRAPALAGVGTHVRLFPRRNLGPGLRAYEAWLGSITDAQSVRRESLIECPLAHPTWMIRREILVEYGYRDAGWPEDYDLLLRILAAGHELGVVPRRLLAWREHERRLTHTGANYRIENFFQLKAAFLRQGLLSEQSTYILWGYGPTGRALRRALLAHDRRPSHIVEVHPGRLGQKIHGAPVIAPDTLAALPAAPIVASVAGEGPRSQIRCALDRMGFHELRDFVCAA